MRMAVILLPAAAVAGCATTPKPQTPIVVEHETAVPVVGGCVPASLGAAPDYPDTDAALKAAPNGAKRYQLMAAGRPLRVARLNELETVVAGCPRAR